MADEVSPEEQKRLDAEAKAKEDAEQAKLPYKWTQTIKDLDITIPIPGNIKGRDLDVTLAKNKLKVAIKGQTPFIDVREVFQVVYGHRKTQHPWAGMKTMTML
jgi:HSP20 family molecular chaperone IbpA